MGAFGWGNTSGSSGPIVYPAEMGGGTGAQAPVGSPILSSPWASALGVLGAGLLSYQGQREANKTNKQIAEATNLFNAAEADKTRTWQALMSNTAFQRQVEDLQKAGLNPLMAAGMSGASTPSGATASGQTAHMENTMSGLQTAARDAVSFNLQAQKQGAEIGLMKDQQNLTRAQTGKAAMETKVMSKGIPEADMKNNVYNWFKNFFQEGKQTGAGIPSKIHEQQSFQQMQNLFKPKQKLP